MIGKVFLSVFISLRTNKKWPINSKARKLIFAVGPFPCVKPYIPKNGVRKSNTCEPSA